MQHVSHNDARDNSNEVKIVEVGETSVKSSPFQSMEKKQVLSSYPANFISDLSHSDEDEASEVESFMLDQESLEDGDTSRFLLSPDNSEGPDIRSVDPETQARLEALLEAAGIGKLSTPDGKALADPEVLRRLTSSVSCALDEAAQALTRMRAEQPAEMGQGDSARSLAKACSSGDIGTVRQLLDEGRSVHETTEEGESLLSLACSAGYYELAQVLLAMRANVEDRGIKGDCTPLMEAASGGHVDIVRLLIANGADVNAQSQAGNTPLHYAACGGHQDVVRVLIEAEANVEEHNENGHTPLMEAASAGHVKVAQILLDAGAGINTHSNEFKESALTLACYKGHLEMVMFLLEAGADHEHKTDEMHTALMEACMDGHVEVARLLLDSGAQVNMPADSFESPLTLAACGGHVDLANLLIERGANLEEVNDEGYTPLMEAAREGHEEMVALLLAHGAEINAQTEETQETALTLACCGGFLEVADFLIKAGADIELGCSTPLMEAAQEGHLDLVKYLLQQGANVHAQTQTGDTALTYACENGHTAVGEVLLGQGAQLEHESEGGRTPLMKAARAGHYNTVQFLIGKGADVNRTTTTNDHTVLSLSSAGGHLQVVELLLRHGADPTHRLKDGSTMLIEASKGGHTTVVHHLLDWPNNILSDASTPATHSTTTTTDIHNAELPRVPMQGLANVVPPTDPNLTFNNNYSQNFTPNVPQIPGDLNLKDLNVARRTLEKAAAAPSKKAGKAAGKNSNVFIGEAVSSAGGVLNLNAAGDLDSDFGAEYAEKNYSESGGSLELEAATAAAVADGGGTASGGGLSDSLKASERLEAFINQMMKKAETLNTTREEQIVKKQQILEELQKVEQELQEKAKQQLLLDTQQKIEQARSKHLEHRGEADGEDVLANLDLDPEEFLKQMQAAVAAYTATGDQQSLACAPTPVPLHIALKKDLEAQVQAAIAAATTKESSEITKIIAKEKLLNGPFDDDDKDKEPSTEPMEDEDQYDEEDEDGKKLPQLAKQESLSSVASSADSGCGNSDINHNGEAALKEAVAPTCAHEDISEEDAESNEAGAELDPDELEEENAAVEQILRECSQQSSRASSEDVDLTGVKPISDVAALKHQLTQQQLALLHQHLLQHKGPIPADKAKAFAQQQQAGAANFVLTPQQQQQVAQQNLMIPVQLETGQPEQQRQQQLQAQQALQQQLQHEMQQQLKLKQEHEQLKQQLKEHQARVALQQKQLQAAEQAQQVTSQVKIQQTTTTTTLQSSSGTGEQQHQLKLQQVELQLQQLQLQLHHVQQQRSDQQLSQQDLLQQAQQLQTQLQQAQQLQQQAVQQQQQDLILQHHKQQQQQIAMYQKAAAAAAAASRPVVTTPATQTPVVVTAAQQQQLQHQQLQIQQAAQIQQLQQQAVQQQKKGKKKLFTVPSSATPPPLQLQAPIKKQQVVAAAGQTAAGHQLLQQLQQQQFQQHQQQQAQMLHNQQLTQQIAAQVANYNTQLAAAAAAAATAPPPPPPTVSVASPVSAASAAAPVYPAVELDAQTESNHDTALTLACAGGHADLVSLLLQRGADIEHRDKKGFTPLILAATAGHADVVEILLEHGADIEAQSERTKDTPLSLACSGGRYEVVELLLARGANKEHRNVSDYTPLSLAASGGYVNIIRLLLSHGAEINSRTGSKLGISPLMLAAMNGHTAAVKTLLDMGSDINAQIETNRNTALTLACFQGRHEVVSLLVDRKANIEHRAKTGLTPLMEAASGGYVEVGRVLLDKGADVNATPVPSSRDTALTIAADKGHYRFVELLISRKAAIDVKNKKGNSPLWLACNGGHLDVVQLLVTARADVDSQDNRRVSCLMAAFRKGHVKVVKYLVKHVTQFPSDQECMRYIATITDTELLKKCHQCMEIIVSAKDRQAAEANKNASILLEEIDAEKSREESKRQAAIKKRERRRKKKKEKQEKERAEREKDDDDDGAAHSKNSTPEPEDKDDDDDEDEEEEEKPAKIKQKKEKKNEVAKEETSLNNAVASSRSNINTVAAKNQSNVQRSNVTSSTSTSSDKFPVPPPPIQSAVSSNAITLGTATSNISVKKELDATKPDNSKNKKRRNRQKVVPTVITPAPQTTVPSLMDIHSLPPIGSTANTTIADDDRMVNKKHNKRAVIPTVSTTGIGDLDDFGVPSHGNKPNSVPKTPVKDSSEPLRPKSTPSSKRVESLLQPGKSKGLHSPSPKKGGGRGDNPRKEEAGWKEVVRKSKKVPVPAGAVSRVIGRGGGNINAIREVSGANIDLDKQGKGGDRTVTIKGSAEATKRATDLIMALIKEPDKEIDQLFPKLMKQLKVSSTNTLTMTPTVWHNSMANNIPSPSATGSTAKTTSKSSTSSSSSSSLTTTKLSSMPNSTVTTSVARAASARTPAATAIGTFHAPPNVWGTPLRSTPTTSAPPLTAVNTPVAKSPSTVARQLFSPSSTPMSSSSSSLSTNLNTSSNKSTLESSTKMTAASASKTTVTYSSPSMAKTKVVATSSSQLLTSVGDKVSSSSTIPVSSTSLVTNGNTPNNLVAAPGTAQPLPITQQNTRTPTPLQQLPAEYSPFNHPYNVDLAERLLGGSGKKEDLLAAADSKMNFASVAAQGVVPSQQQQQGPPGQQASAQQASSNDPGLQAKAPGYKAPGQRTSSPQVITEQQQEHLARAPGYKGNLYMQSQQQRDSIEIQNMLGVRPPPYMTASPYHMPGVPQANNLNGGGQSPRPMDNHVGFAMRDEYSTPDQPMTLPKIESNLNPDAPDFMVVGGQQQAAFLPAGAGIPFHPAFRTGTTAHPAAAMFSQSNFPNTLAALTDMQMMAAAGSFTGANFGGPGGVPPPTSAPGSSSPRLPQRQYSPMPRNSGASSVASSSHADGGSGEASPSSSTAHSPTERPPRPIGGERRAAAASSTGEGGFQATAADMAGLWNNYKQDLPEWLAQVSTAVMTSTVVSSTVMTDERPRSHPNPSSSSAYDQACMDRVGGDTGYANTNMPGGPPLFAHANGLPPQVQALFNQADSRPSANMWSPKVMPPAPDQQQSEQAAAAAAKMQQAQQMWSNWSNAPI